MIITKRMYIRTVSLFIAIIVVLAVWNYSSYSKISSYKKQMEYTYARSLSELSDYLSNISTDLQKGLYVGTPQQLAMVSAKLWRESGAAKAALSAIPTTGLNLDNTYKFLSQVGDYAMVLSKQVGNGNQITEQQRKSIANLSRYAITLDGRFEQLSEQIANGLLTIDTLMDSPEFDAEDPQIGIQAEFYNMEQQLTDYPTLIYDGPFSDHIMQKTPLLTAAKPEITLAQAKSKAAIAANVSIGSLEQDEDEVSHMPSYIFSNENVSLGITKNGGYLTYLLSKRAIGVEKISRQNAQKRAEDYLGMLGIENMKLTYYDVNDGVYTANFASTQNDILLYTDLIKVGVALDTGETVFYDGRGYIVNHTERQIEPPTLSADQAIESVSKNLLVHDSCLVLIPSSGLNEVLAYEFKCKGEGDINVLVYINAMSGVEERILLLIESPNGTLTK